jgi:hypothetical protein
MLQTGFLPSNLAVSGLIALKMAKALNILRWSMVALRGYGLALPAVDLR